jgi:multiple sugar transport system substrate-binding protein
MATLTNVSRRGFLGTIATVVAGSAGVLLLQACGGAAPAAETPTAAPAAPAAAPAAAAPTNTPAPAPAAQPTATLAAAAAQPTATTAAATAATATPAAQAAPASGAPTQFTYTARIGVQADHFDAFAKKFMQQYPNIKYVPQHIAGNEWLQKIQVEAAGGTLADAFWMPSIGLFGQFAHQGLLLELDPLVKTQNFDLSVFYPAAVQGLTKGGKLYGIPWIVHPGRTGLYYNKPLFDAAGIKYPDGTWTYQDLVTAAQKLTKSSGGKYDQYGYQPGTDMWSYIVVLRGYGGDYLNADGTKVTIDSPESTKAIQEGIADLMSKYKTSPTPDTVEGGSPQMFASKRLAMFQSGYWGASGLFQYAKDLPWDVAPMPIQSGGKLGMFEIDTNSVSKTAKDPQSAFLFCTFMASKEAGIDIAVRGSVPGGRPDVWAAPELADKSYHVTFAKILANCPGLLLPANFKETELSDAFQKGFDPINYAKEGDASKIIKDLTPILQEIVSRPA